MRPQTIVDWKQLEYLVAILVAKLHGHARFTGVFGIPTGGAVVGAMVAGQLRLPLVDAPTPTTLVVDDICDSGKTLSGMPSDCQTAVLHARTKSAHLPTYVVEISEDWIAYPYEHSVVGEEVVTRMLELLGEDPTREGLVDTPARVLRSWSELFSGYKREEPELTSFADTYDEMVVSRNIDFMSACEHHMLPFYGKAHVCYIPNGKVVGVSKLTRVVDYFARRLQIQERLTQQIADKIVDALAPRGVGVVLQGTHLCMVARGVKQPSSVMVTSAVRGALRNDPAARSEFLSLSRTWTGGA